MRTHRDAKAMAKALKEELGSRGISLSHSEALEIIARQFGLPNWNVLSAGISKEQSNKTASGIRFEDAVPIIRIFDVAKAHEFYLGFLGFSVDWEHRFEAALPLYTQVSREGLRLHLSEHAGDATPGGNMCVYMSGIRAFYAELTAKQYPYMRPGFKELDGRFEVEVTDPFANRIRFMELT